MADYGQTESHNPVIKSRNGNFMGCMGWNQKDLRLWSSRGVVTRSRVMTLLGLAITCDLFDFTSCGQTTLKLLDFMVGLWLFGLTISCDLFDFTWLDRQPIHFLILMSSLSFTSVEEKSDKKEMVKSCLFSSYRYSLWLRWRRGGCKQ